MREFTRAVPYFNEAKQSSTERNKGHARKEVGARSVESGDIWALFRSGPVNSVNTKKTSHRMFRHMHGVLNEVYL